MRDPGNLGTLLRTGDAVGAGGVILVDDCCDPFSVEAVRASMGALFTQQVVQASWSDFIAWLRTGEAMLIGTSLATDLDYQHPRSSEEHTSELQSLMRLSYAVFVLKTK